jgi:TPR repeat protein
MQLFRKSPISLSVALLACVLYLPSSHAISPEEKVMKLTSDAEGGSLPAEIELGARYMTGEGVTRDLAAAARWYEKAAQRGEPHAQNQIGYFYQSGIGVPQDYARAMRWYQLAASNGDASALLNIGVLYFTGTGVKKDIGYAAGFFENAVRKGNGTAAAYLGDIYYSGALGTVDLAQADKWFETGSRLNDPLATYNLGLLYSSDSNHPHDFHRAASLLRRSANYGYVPAMHSLALLLINHPQEEQTNGEVRSLLETAAAAGEWKSSIVLGILSRDGKILPTDKRTADYYFHVAALMGGKHAHDLVMYDLSKLDPTFDSAQREAILNEARSWCLQHSKVKKFLVRDPREIKFFPSPQSNWVAPELDISGPVSSAEAPCTIDSRSS